MLNTATIVAVFIHTRTITMDAFDVLGVPPNCNIDVAKNAYRKLAMKHHPDKGGDTVAFQRIQAAWDKISSGYKRFVKTEQPRKSAGASAAGGSSFKDVYSNFKTSMRGGDGYVHITIPPFKHGRHADIVFNNRQYILDSPPVNGWAGKIYEDNSNIMPGVQKSLENINAQIELTPPNKTMFIRGLENSHHPLARIAQRCGDVVDYINVNAINLILGGWFTIKDVFGEEVKFRIPAGFNPENTLRIADRGYYLYESLDMNCKTERADFFVKVNPIFTPISGLEENDLNALKEAIG